VSLFLFFQVEEQARVVEAGTVFPAGTDCCICVGGWVFECMRMPECVRR
jgi:hypothetical protein